MKKRKSILTSIANRASTTVLKSPKTRAMTVSQNPALPIFKALEKYGEIKHEEMFEIFNMGIGLMLAVKPENVERVKELLDESVYEIGRILK